MSKGGNPSSVTSTTSSEPSDFVKPYLTEAFGQAQNLFQSAVPNYYPNQTYADFAPETSAALNLATQRATQGNPLLGASQNEINNILSGQYLSPTSNPYSQALYDQMAGDVTAGVQSQFSKAGRLGSGANQEVLASELGNIANQVYGSQYQQERQNMLGAAQMAPQLAQADYADIQALGGVGQQREAMDMAKPYYKLREYLASVGSPYAQNVSQTQPVFRNTGAGLLGGAMAGGQIAAGIPQLSAGMGAFGGGLLGGFF